MKKKLIIATVLASSLLVGCGGGNEIDMVKSRSYKFNTSLTIGEALESYKDCDKQSIQWRMVESERGVKSVVFSCSLKSVKPVLAENEPNIISNILGHYDAEFWRIPSKDYEKDYLTKYKPMAYALLEEKGKSGKDEQVRDFRRQLASIRVKSATLHVPFHLSKADSEDFSLGKFVIHVVPEEDKWVKTKATNVTIDNNPVRVLRDYIYKNVDLGFWTQQPIYQTVYYQTE